MAHLPVGTALGLGWRALSREGWLVAVSLVVAILRRVVGWPAVAVTALLAVRGATGGMALAPASVEAPLVGAAMVLGQPRMLSLVVGLWLAGTLLALALRLAWLAGALPTLAAALGPAPDPVPRFADGVAHLTPRLIPVTALCAVMELSGWGFSVVLLVAAARISGSADAGGAWLAAPVALALVLAIAVPLALSVVADAALVRAAVRAEGPAMALARAVERFVARPSAFLAATLAAALAGAVVLGSVQGAGELALGLARTAGPVVALGPQLMVTTAAVAIAGALELWWLASLTALVTSEDAESNA
jgi:hypothetical protein